MRARFNRRETVNTRVHFNINLEAIDRVTVYRMKGARSEELARVSCYSFLFEFQDIKGGHNFVLPGRGITEHPSHARLAQLTSRIVLISERLFVPPFVRVSSLGFHAPSSCLSFDALKADESA